MMMMMMRVMLPVFVDESVEGHAVTPACGEVVDVDVGIPADNEEQVNQTEAKLNVTFHRLYLKSTFMIHISLN